MRRLVRSPGHQANGQWSQAVPGRRVLAGAPSQPCHQAIRPFLAPVPAVPALTQDCLVGRLHVCPHYLYLSHPAHSITASQPLPCTQALSPSKHPNPITTTPHIPQPPHPIISPLHPEFRLSPHAPEPSADALDQQPRFRPTRTHFVVRTSLSFLLSTPAEDSLAPVALLQADVRKQASH